MNDAIKSTWSRIDWLTVGVIGVTVAATAAVYGRLPDPMPTHFNFRGEADGWGTRASGAWLLPATAATLALLIRFGKYLSKGPARDRMEASPLSAMACVTAACLCGLQVLVLRASLSPSPHLDVDAWVFAGAAWTALGLVMPRTRRNRWFGVRTPWSLSSDENWARTHRVAGYSMTFGGLLVAFAGLLGNAGLALAAFVTSALMPIFWSWRVRKSV